MTLTLQINGCIENRIEALVSGMCWAEELGCSLEVWWWYFPFGVQCPYNRCFDLSIFPPWVSFRPGFLHDAATIRSEKEFIEKGYPNYIQSKAKFYTKDNQKYIHYLRLLKPSFEIANRLTMIPSQGSIGIYVHGLKECPVPKLLAEIWLHHRDAKYFLVSTDCMDTKRFLEIMFRERVYFTNSQITPHSEKYVMDRLVDFFSLSKCTSILNPTNDILPLLASSHGMIQLISLHQ